jgi:hypothetical protein
MAKNHTKLSVSVKLGKDVVNLPVFRIWVDEEEKEVFLPRTAEDFRAFVTPSRHSFEQDPDLDTWIRVPLVSIDETFNSKQNFPKILHNLKSAYLKLKILSFLA